MKHVDRLSLLPCTIIDLVLEHVSWLETKHVLSLRSKHLAMGIVRRLQSSFLISTRQTDSIVRMLQDQHIFLSGQSGSGKTHVLVVAARMAIEMYGPERVGVMTTTNIAASRLSIEIQNTVLKVQVVLKYKKWVGDDRSQSIANKSIVFVDDATILSSTELDELVELLSPTCQLVLAGDILQSSSTSKRGDSITRIFRSKYFDRFAPVELLTNWRCRGDAHRDTFRHILSRLRVGLANDADESWIRSNMANSTNEDILVLPTISACANHNTRRFQELPTPIVTFQTDEEIESRSWKTFWDDNEKRSVTRHFTEYVMVNPYLHHPSSTLTKSERCTLHRPIDIPRFLNVRIGATVMITRTLYDDDEDVPVVIAPNGAIGTIVDIQEDYILLVLHRDRQRVVVTRVCYRRPSVTREDDTVRRTWLCWQLPIAISYAISTQMARDIDACTPIRFDVTSLAQQSSQVYAMIGHMAHVTQFCMSLNSHGRVFDPSQSRPEPEVLDVHRRFVRAYTPLRWVVDAIGKDDVLD